MLCDEAFNKLPWQAMLRGRLRARWRARMILLTDDGRAELAGDLVRAGGFDFLTHPFDKDQVFATLISAYAQWRGNEYPSAPARQVSPTIGRKCNSHTSSITGTSNLPRPA